MAMPPCGTFDYVGVVPPDFAHTQRMVMSMREPLTLTGDDLRDKRLVGYSPSLRFIEAGLTPEAPPNKPELLTVQRTQFVLTCTQSSEGACSSASFHIDHDITTRLVPGDCLYLVRTMSGGLAISVLRQNELIVAAGALTDISLGKDLLVRHPWEVIDEAENCFQKIDPNFGFQEYPIEITGYGETHIVYRNSLTIRNYHIYVSHGFYDGEPGKAASVGIAKKGVCPVFSARTTAQFLEHEGLTMYD